MRLRVRNPIRGFLVLSLHAGEQEERMNLLYIILIVVLVLALLGFVGGRGRW